MSSALVGLGARLVAATNPLTLAAGLSLRGWVGLTLSAALLYLHQRSTLARASRDAPCIAFGAVFRTLYGLFGTWLAEAVLGRMLHTPKGQPQAPQAGGTVPTLVGEPGMRVLMVPILGEAFGGNYAFIVWDEADEERRALAVDAADPYPVLEAARARGLTLRLLLTTHWHFDHSSGNRALAAELPGLEVVAGAEEVGRTPAVTRRMGDRDELRLGRLVVRAHAVPGHTRGSVVYEVFNADSPPSTPSAAFTGDTLFCGGCGALFECSADVLHRSLQTLTRQRLTPATRLFPGHEYSEMLLRQALQRDPANAAARTKLDEVRLKRARKQPSLPSTIAEELTYNAQLLATREELAVMCGCEPPK
jgi:hydroxyacylglutathione hydrolase